MIGKEAAIKRYRKKLPAELAKRYGGKPPYTEAQVSKTVQDLRLNQRFIRYAFLMYCEQEVLAGQGVDESTIAIMLAEIEQVSGGSVIAVPIDAVFGIGDSDGGSIGEGGGGE